jgi:hypothetical protein
VSDTEPQPEELDSVPLANSYGWQRRLLVTLVSCLVVVVVAALTVIVAERARPSHLVYPASVQATMEAGMEYLYVDKTGNRPVSDEMLKTLVKAYGLEDCQVGGKYGALCQDGTLEQTQLLREDQLDEMCSQHGGVKEWIECR